MKQNSEWQQDTHHKNTDYPHIYSSISEVSPDYPDPIHYNKASYLNLQDLNTAPSPTMLHSKRSSGDTRLGYPLSARQRGTLHTISIPTPIPKYEIDAYNEIIHLRESLSAAERNIWEQTTAIELSKHDIHNHEKTTQALKTEISQLNRRLKDNEQQLEKWKKSTAEAEGESLELRGRVSQLSEEIVKMREVNRRLDEESRRFRERIQELEVEGRGRAEMLQQELENEKEKFEELKERYDRETEQLGKELASIKRMYGMCQKKNQDLTEQSQAQIQKMMEEARQTESQLTHKLKHMSKRHYQELQQEKQNLNTEITNLNNQYSKQLETLQYDHETQLKNLESSYQNSEYKLTEGFQKQIHELQNLCKSLEKQLNSQKDTHQQQISQTQFKAAEEWRNKIESLNDKHLADLQDLRIQIRQKDKQLESANLRGRRLEDELEDRKQRVFYLEEQQEALRSSLLELDEIKQGFSAQIIDVTTDLENVQAEMSIQKKARAQAEAEVQQYKEREEHLKFSLTNQQQSLQKQIENLQSNYLGEISELQMTIEKMNSKLSEVKNKMNKKDHDNKKLHSTNHNLNSQIQELTLKYQNELSTKAQEYQQILSQEKQHSDTLNETIQRLQKQLDYSNTENEYHQQHYQNINNELLLTKKQNAELKLLTQELDQKCSQLQIQSEQQAEGSQKAYALTRTLQQKLILNFSTRVTRVATSFRGQQRGIAEDMHRFNLQMDLFTQEALKKLYSFQQNAQDELVQRDILIENMTTDIRYLKDSLKSTINASNSQQREIASKLDLQTQNHERVIETLKSDIQTKTLECEEMSYRMKEILHKQEKYKSDLEYTISHYQGKIQMIQDNAERRIKEKEEIYQKAVKQVNRQHQEEIRQLKEELGRRNAEYSKNVTNLHNSLQDLETQQVLNANKLQQNVKILQEKLNTAKNTLA